MRLEEYVPFSELVVPETEVTKSRLPVIDAHSHWGKLLLGDNYNAAYDTTAVVNALKSVGLEGIVNVDGFWGEELDKMLAKTEESAGFIKTFSSVDVTRAGERDFESLVYRTIRDAKAKGVAGLNSGRSSAFCTAIRTANLSAPMTSSCAASGSARRNLICRCSSTSPTRLPSSNRSTK